MLEYWNDETMGSGKMSHWVIGKTTVDGEVQKSNASTKNQHPVFQHSSIPD